MCVIFIQSVICPHSQLSSTPPPFPSGIYQLRGEKPTCSQFLLTTENLLTLSMYPEKKERREKPGLMKMVINGYCDITAQLGQTTQLPATLSTLLELEIKTTQKLRK